MRLARQLSAALFSLLLVTSTFGGVGAVGALGSAPADAAVDGLQESGPLDAPTTAAVQPADFTREQIASGLGTPMSITFLPDGRALVGQKNGEILIADLTGSTVATETYMTIPDVVTSGEKGLLDVTLDPNFGQNGYFYAYYSKSSANKNRLVRFTHDEGAGGLDSSADPASEALIWEEPEELGSCCHMGGGLDFGPDGKLYLTTGDDFVGASGGDSHPSQDLTNSGGKLLRFNPDPANPIPSDNPYVDDPDALDAIWAHGLRNPWRANFDEETDRFFIGDVGGNNGPDREEINVGQELADYGWPHCEGTVQSNVDEPCDVDQTDPLYDYPHSEGNSVTGGVVYRGGQFPDEFQGAYFFGDFAQDWLKYMTFAADGSVDQVQLFDDNVDDPVTIQEGSDGNLYVATVNGVVYRYTYVGNAAPQLTDVTATPTSGAAPLTVSFEASATDGDGDPLTYTWDFGDGTGDTGSSVSHTYDEAGSYEATVAVSDGTTTVTSDPIQISVGSTPSVTIDEPTDGDTFRAGDTIQFSGSATDPDDGALTGDSLSWDVVFNHDPATGAAHQHPVLTDVSGASGEYVVDSTGHDYRSDTSYTFTLTATDSDGLSSSESVTVYPEKSTIVFETNPSGLDFAIDGIPFTSTTTFDTLVGFEHTLSAPTTQCLAGTEYSFDSWSDGGAQTHTYVVPETDETVTANYVVSGECDVPVSDGLVFHLTGDAGVTTDATGVTAWADQSGQGNDLTGVGDPQLVTDGLNGHDVVSFDGDGDKAERTATLNGLPTGSADRTMFLVAKYDGADAWGGAAYGTGAPNEAFGLVVQEGGGVLVTQGWGSGNDFVSDEPGIGAGWLTHSAVVESNVATQYKDGVQLGDSFSHSYATSSSKIVVGEEIAGLGYVDVEVAEVLVFDRALSDTERQQVESYLQEKYFDAGGDQCTFADIASVNDPADRFDVQEVQQAINWWAQGTDAEVQLTLTETQQIISLWATGATVTCDTANEPPTAGDDSAEVAPDGSVTIDVLANDADSDGSLDPASVTIVDEPTAGSAVVETDGTVTYTAPASETSDSFTYTVDDDDGATSNLATVSVTVTESPPATDVPVTNGLVLALQSDDGVTTDATGVTGWADQSGQGNDLTGAGDPQLATGTTPGGQPAIVFDGDGDKLERTETLNGLPTGSADRTMFLVAKYDDAPAFGGASYGTGATNQAFGLVVNDGGGDLTVQGWGSGNDIVSDEPGVGAGWLSQSAVVEADAVSHYKDGVLIDSGTQTYATGSTKFVLAEEIANIDFVDMDIAAVFVYDRALSDEERQQVETYVQEKYVQPATTNQPPTASDDTATVEQGQQVTIDVLANDADPDGSLDPASVTIDSEPSAGTATVNADGSITYENTDTTATSDSFVYTVQDDDTAGDAATVEITITEPTQADVPVTDGLVLALEADTGVTTDATGVTGWADQSGQGNDLTSAGDPQLVTSATPGGQSAIAFDGDGDKLERTETLNGFPSGSADRTMFTVVNYDSNGFGGVAYGSTNCNEVFGLIVDNGGNLAVQGWCDDFSSDEVGNGAGWLSQSAVVEADQLTHYKDGVEIDTATHTYNTDATNLVLGAEVDSNPYLDMDVAAVFLYDRALSDEERQQVETYIQETYIQTTTNEAPTANDDSAEVAPSESVNIDVLANDADTDGSLDPASVTIVDAPAEGSAVVETDGTVTYTAPASETSDSFTYTVDDDDGATSNLATVSVTVTSPTTTIPVSDGLVFHLTGDAGVTTDATGVTGWADQSGQGNDLTGAGDPQLVTDGLNGHDVVSFDGDGDKAERTATLNGLPTGSADRTMFLVAKYDGADAYAGAAYGTGSSNEAFGLVVDGGGGDLTVQGWGGGNDLVSDEPGVGAGWLSQSAVVEADAISHYKDGTLIDSGTQTYATGSTKIVLAEEIAGAGYADVEIAEVVVYDRALTDEERQQVESYLQEKYFP